MSISTFLITPIKTHQSFQKIEPISSNGVMIPLANQFLEPGFDIQFVYAITCEPRKIKGPYCHTKRNGRLCLLDGYILIIHRFGSDGPLLEDYILAPNPKMIHLPAGEEYCIVGAGWKTSTLINICDYAWKPNDEETYVPDFSSYNFSNLQEK